tara:strand:+ start:271 stop:1956 length:1686 start_codon:yes stop_codon:yes gene_type:complete
MAVNKVKRSLGLKMLLSTVLIVVLVMLLGTFYLRFDLTASKQYSLSSSTKDLIARLDDRLQVKLYFNKDIEGHEYLLPERLLLQDLLAEIEHLGGDLVSVETVDPTADLVASRDAEHVGITAVPLNGQDVGSLSIDLLYQGLEMRYQNSSEVIPFVRADEFEFAFSVRLAALIAGEKPVVGLMSNEPLLPPQMPGIPRQVPDGRVFEQLRNALGERYTVRDVSTTQEAEIDLEGVSTLIVARPYQFPEKFMAAIKDFLSAGNSVLLLYDSEFVESNSLKQTAVSTGLESWLTELGVDVSALLVYDSNSIKVQSGSKEIETPSGMQRVPLQAPYGFGVFAENDSLNREHQITAALGSVAFFWAHAIDTSGIADNLSAIDLVRSSDQSWLLPADSELAMSTENIRDLQIKAYASGPPQSYALVSLISGDFGNQGKAGRLVVTGDSDLFHNLTLQSSENPNREFAANLIDWLSNDSGLITLRSRGHRQRPLHDFAATYVSTHGGFTDDETDNALLSKAAWLHTHFVQRTISLVNVFAPMVFMLTAGALHFVFRRRKAKQVKGNV